MSTYIDPPPPMRNKIAKRTEVNQGLPPYMEARTRKNGGASYRMRLQNGTTIPLGWNRDEALELYRQIASTGLSSERSPLEWATEIHKRQSAGAKQRGIEFTVTIEQLASMLEAQNNACALTDIAFSNFKPPGARIRPWAPSIDRIDPKRSYSPDNCRIVCAFVNVALNEFGEEIFFGILEKMMRRVAREEIAQALKNTGLIDGPFPNGKKKAPKPKKPATPKNKSLLKSTG